MQFVIRRVVLRDFKEYRGKHVLRLSERGVHFIRGRSEVPPIGSNGAGKSTIWDAVSWCLTGKTTRGLRGTDVRTWGGDQHAKVSVAFLLDDRTRIVKRSTEKNGLWLDGKLTSQEAIERELGFTPLTLMHTIILGQKRELFFDLKPADKLQILSEALQLEKWNDRSALARDKARKAKMEMQNYEHGMGVIETRVAELRTQLDEAREKASAWEDERSKGSDKRASRIKELKKAYAKFEKERGDHDLAYDGAETELRALRSDLKKKRDEHAANVKAHAAAVSVLANLQTQIDKLNQIKTVCPTCGQKIRDAVESKKHREREINGLCNVMLVESHAEKKARKARKRSSQALEIMEQAVIDFGKKSDDAKDKYDQLTTRMTEADKELAVLKVKSREDETNPHEEAVRLLRTDLKRQQRLLTEARAERDKYSRRATRLDYWIDGFKQIRLYLLEEALQELEETTQNMLPSLGLSGWRVQYAIERETKTGTISTGLTVTILKPGMDKGVKWEAWSGGENQRLLVCGALALSDVLLGRMGIECPQIVLDEPTRHMSKEGVSDLVDYLVELGKTKGVYYVDHAAIESSRFAEVITVTKDKEGSRIETTH